MKKKPLDKQELNDIFSKNDRVRFKQYCDTHILNDLNTRIEFSSYFYFHSLEKTFLADVLDEMIKNNIFELYFVYRGDNGNAKIKNKKQSFPLIMAGSLYKNDNNIRLTFIKKLLPHKDKMDWSNFEPSNPSHYFFLNQLHLQESFKKTQKTVSFFTPKSKEYCLKLLLLHTYEQQYEDRGGPKLITSLVDLLGTMNKTELLNSVDAYFEISKNINIPAFTAQYLFDKAFNTNEDFIIKMSHDEWDDANSEYSKVFKVDRVNALYEKLKIEVDLAQNNSEDSKMVKRIKIL